jgi:hypothetical protein
MSLTEDNRLSDLLFQADPTMRAAESATAGRRQCGLPPDSEMELTTTPRSRCNAEGRKQLRTRSFFAKMDIHRERLIGITACVVRDFRVAYRMRWRHIVAQDPQSFAVGDVDQVPSIIQEKAADSLESLKGPRIRRITQVEES